MGFSLGELLINYVTSVNDQVHWLRAPNYYALHNVLLSQLFHPSSGKFVIWFLNGSWGALILVVVSVRIYA